MNYTSEIVIIGGGIIGCASAYYLAKKGCKVTVLEGSDYIGNGGSSRNGGGVRQSGRDPRELPMVMWGIKNLWPALSEELGFDVEYVQKGNLRLGKTQKHLEILQGLTDRAVACGLDVRMIDGDEVRQINPYLSEEVIGASWCPTDGHANPLAATLAYYKAARSLGVRFITGEKVVQLRKYKGSIRKVITETNVYEAEKVLVAAGYESRDILGTVGIDVPMIKEKVEVIVTEAEKQMFPQMLGTAEADFYGHQTKHGSFVFGGYTGFEDFEKDNGKNIGASVGLGCTCRGIIKYFPALANTKIVRAWSGELDVCKDKIPVISEIEEVPGLYTACAFSGHGFGIAPGAAYNIAELMTDKNFTVDNMSDFRYDRFSTKI
ncbi:MAG: FAD-binding oxidoreductase [Ruminococcus sp.]|jgi:sarcosine oxidase subunit beta|nr:FAD-binding oxidoreductase [Ruminococcus sp.]